MYGIDAAVVVYGIGIAVVLVSTLSGAYGSSYNRE